MASKTFNIRVLTYRDIDVMLYEKDVKHVTIKVPRKDPHTIHISHPQGMSDHKIMDMLEDEYDNMKALLSKALHAPTELVMNPTSSDIERLRHNINDIVAEMEHAMEIKVARYSIKLLKSRWGSCNREKHHICINAALARLPREYTEYVVIHEMVHIIEEAHTPVFWSIVRRYCPNYLRLRNDLKNKMKF